VVGFRLFTTLVLRLSLTSQCCGMSVRGIAVAAVRGVLVTRRVEAVVLHAAWLSVRSAEGFQGFLRQDLH